MQLQHERPTRRRPLTWLRAVLIGLLITSGTIFASAGPAQAETGGYPYATYNGPGTNPAGSFWADSSGNGVSPYGYYYRNCTDYVAWKLQSLGVSDTKTRGLGNGGEWAARANGRAGVTVNTVPAYGAAAVAPSTSNNPYGHVAFVEAVNSNGTITISEYNWATPTPDGNYHQQTGTPAALGFTQFAHFEDVSGGASHRIALLNSSGQMYAKDTLAGGGWISQGASASAIDVGGSRMALLNSANQVFAKDSLGTGGWISQGTTAKKVVVGSGGRMFIINSANQVYGKDNASIAGGWASQGASAIDVAVGTNRVAIVTPCGAVYAKSNLSNGGWIKQADCNTAKDVELSSTGLIAIIRTDGAVFAKDNASGLGGWIDQGANATQLKLGANRLLILTPGSYVYAKDSLGTGGWISQGTSAVEIAISDQGRFVVRNTANQVYAKDTINPGGWVSQEAGALEIAG